MAQTALNLIDHVLPSVGLRQFVLTLPFELRARLAYDGKLWGAVTRVFSDSVLGFYRRRLRALDGVTGRSGAVTVVQRTSSDLRLNPHLHALLLDGVYCLADDSTPVFHPLPSLDTEDVADLLQVVRVRLLRLLERQGVIESRSELSLLDDGLAEREPALAQLAAAAVSGLPPAGPEQRQRPPVTLRGEPGVRVTAPLCATELGFSLHAATRATSSDARGRKALVRYALRPALAQERLQLLPSGLVRIALRRPFRDGTVAVDLDPLSLLCRLAAAVPPPRMHLVRYSGVLGCASKWRALVVPPPPAAPAEQPAPTQHSAKPRPPTHRSRYRPWAELLKRTFAIEVELCPKCSGRMKLIALVTEPSSVTRFLRHLGEPTDAPAMSAARDPPYFTTRAVRRALGELDPPLREQQTQGELF